MPKSNLYIGVLSGTSADSIDAVIIKFKRIPEIVSKISIKMPENIKRDIFQLVFSRTDKNFFKKQKKLDDVLGELIGKSINKLLKKSNVSYKDIKAVGSHGQTIKHSNSKKKPFSLQVGNPKIIKDLTGIKVISGFRQSDIKNGGSGAPLTPAFHKEFLSHKKINRAIINIGGITNITLLPVKGKIKGWDIGPGNCLIDQGIRKITNGEKEFDLNGNVAKKGNALKLTRTINTFLKKDYFNKDIPKSQSIENYNLKDIKINTQEKAFYKNEDLIAALTEITFQSILKDLKKYCKDNYEIYFCGGGTKNNFLMKKFKDLSIPNLKFFVTNEIGLNPMDIEAMTFAWLAMQRLSKQKIYLNSVTGSRACLMGQITD
jgi:anhydro-N-acetylmuramic acid kinase